MIRDFLFNSGLQRPLSKSPVKTPVLLILQSGMDSTAFFVSLMRSSSKLCCQPRCDLIFYLFQRQLQNALIVQPQVSKTIKQSITETLELHFYPSAFCTQGKTLFSFTLTLFYGSSAIFLLKLMVTHDPTKILCKRAYKQFFAWTYLK